MSIAAATNKFMLEELLTNCRKNLSKPRLDLIEQAFDFASIAHENDTRASNEPYITHPFAVANILATEIPFDDVSVVCGLLHDVVEDNAEYTSDSIKKHFGEDISIIVDGLTKIKNLFKGADINQGENYRKLLMSISKDVRVIIVKFADRLHNMRTIEYLNPDKRKRVAKETLELYAPLAHRFGLGKLKWELEDLAFKELNKQAYEDIKKKINSKRQEREKYIQKFSEPLIQKLNEQNYKFEISGRPKHLYSIYKKMIKRHKPFEEIYDLFAFRIIIDTDDSSQCYHTLGFINQIYLPVPDRFKDYVAIPKSNNYQSIHTTVVGPDGILVEVQIRTRKMHEIAEQGVAAHWKYKEGKVAPERTIDGYVGWIRELLENTGGEDLRKSIIDNFKLNLYSDEIYIFTPKGELRRLPQKATPIDFAFEIHSKVGFHCLGAKVNQRIVPIDTVLQSGDQVEILTSKNQKPNKSWLKFVVTQKAKSEIKKFLNREEEIFVIQGKELFEKKIKKLKLVFNSDEVNKLANNAKYDNSRQLYKEIAQGKVNLDELLTVQTEKDDKKVFDVNLEFETFQNYARTTGGSLVVDGESSQMLYSYSKCCNPIPGDPVVGFVTVGEGVKIHRKNCKNLISILEKEPEKIQTIQWPKIESSSFIVALTIRGSDSPGILHEITNTIVTYKNTNIKSVNIDSKHSGFAGFISLYVTDLEHLQRIIDRLKKLKGVSHVARLESVIN